MPLLRAASRFFHTVGTLCFPPHCAHCQGDTQPGVYVCDRCETDLPRLEEPFCQRCSWPFRGAITEEFVCADCHDRTVHYDCAVAAYRARGAVREMIHQFKYESRLYLRVPLSRWLAETMHDPRMTARKCDAFVPVPLHPVRKRERDFNQAEELSRFLSRETGIPSWPHVLRRIRYTTTQTRLSREERMENLRGAFQVRHTGEVKGRDLVLVDDVFTTGSTVEECSRVLRRAGAASVRVITIARG